MSTFFTLFSLLQLSRLSKVSFWQPELSRFPKPKHLLMSIQRKATCYDQCHLWTDFQIAKKEKTGEIFQILFEVVE